MTAAKKALDALATGATEAEADPGRQEMEIAILSTAAKVPLDDSFRVDFVVDAGRKFSFSRSDLAAIAGALADCLMEGVPADEIIVRQRLAGAGKKVRDDVLASILTGSKAVDPEVARKYMEILHAWDRYRGTEAVLEECRRKLAEAREKGGDGREIYDVFDEVVKTFFDGTQDRRLIFAPKAEAEDWMGFFEDVANRGIDGRPFLGLTTGFNRLDEILNGLTPGLYIFGGMTACGKTTLLKQIADNIAAVEKVPVLFFSYEQSKEELRIKSLARLSGIDTRRIWKGRWAAPEIDDQISTAMQEYIGGPGPYLKIIEAGREDTVERIRALSLMEKRQTGKAPVIILDYLQIVPAIDPLTNGRPFPSVREKVDFLCSEFRRLARDLQAPVLAASSFNRAAYSDENERPGLVAFKESGGIEYSADAAFTLWQDKKEVLPFETETRRIILNCVKNRNGETGEIKLNFIPAWAKFEDVI